MRNVLFVGLLAPALWSCGSVSARNDASLGDAPIGNPALTEVALFPAAMTRDLDLLFVIDDSPSMLDKQTNLRNNFPNLINVLNSSPGGLPNLHIGVVTTDLGTKGADDAQPGPGIGSGPSSCAGLGKDGALQVNGAQITGNFLSDVASGTGRNRNYNGTLNDAFAAMSNVGASGCGFEQPLAAMHRALTNTTANVGFLRPEARLGVVVLADEDDCSISHSTLMGTDSTTLGPLTSFRCTRFGVTCGVGGTTPDEMNSVGTKSSCRSNESSEYLTDVQRYVSFVNGLKSDRREVLFAAIAGATSPFVVELRTPPGGGTAINAVGHSCTYTGQMGPEVADPPARIADFASKLSRGHMASVCNGDLSGVLTTIGLQLRSLIGDSCLTHPIAMPATCEAFDIDAQGNARPLPSCESTGNAGECFSLVTDTAACPTAQGLRVQVNRTLLEPPAGLYTSIRCAL